MFKNDTFHVKTHYLYNNKPNRATTPPTKFSTNMWNDHETNMNAPNQNHNEPASVVAMPWLK